MDSLQTRLIKEIEKMEEYRKERFEYNESLLSELYFDEEKDRVLYAYIFGMKNTEHHKAIFRL